MRAKYKNEEHANLFPLTVEITHSQHAPNSKLITITTSHGLQSNITYPDFLLLEFLSLSSTFLKVTQTYEVHMKLV